MKRTIQLWLMAVAVMTLCMGFTACSKDDSEDEQPPKTTIDGYEYVDLGLSVKWAKSNLKGFYQYGNPTANSFSSDDYALPTYNIGGTSKDPAYANMSSKWRLPTSSEMQELADECKWVLVTESNGTRHFHVTGPSGKSIDLPCSGAYPIGNSSSLLYENYQCWLMTSSLDGGGNPRPYILKGVYTNENISPTYKVTTNEVQRISGISVRGVSTADPDQVTKNDDKNDDGPGTPQIANQLLGSWYSEEIGSKDSDYSYEIWCFEPNGILVEYYLGVITATTVDGTLTDWRYDLIKTEDPYTFDPTTNTLAIVDKKEGLFYSKVKYDETKGILSIVGPAEWGWTRNMKRYDGMLPPPEGRLFNNQGK